jgi:hypothetical protein
MMKSIHSNYINIVDSFDQEVMQALLAYTAITDLL